jgi:hypothetical protein
MDAGSGSDSDSGSNGGMDGHFGFNTDGDFDGIETSTSTDDEEHGRILTESEVRLSQQELWVESTIVHYPGNRAGEVGLKGITVMQEYENTVGGPSENPYSPFHSKIDWELAKWAKLRGPSATSFTELLNIDGVSIFNKSPNSVVSPLSSSCMNN